MSFQSFAPTSEIENKAASIVKSILSNSATVTSANFIKSSKAVNVIFNRPDIEEFEPRKFCRQLLVFNNDSVLSLPDIPLDGRVKAWTINNNDNSSEARVVTPTVANGTAAVGATASSSLYLEVYKNGYEIVRRQLPKDIQDVRNGGPFGELQIYNDEYVIIPAERKLPNYPKTWWSTEIKDNNNGKADITPMDKFRYQANFGEKLTYVKEPCVYIYCIKDDKFIDVTKSIGKEFMKDKTIGYTTFSKNGKGLFITMYHNGPTPLAKEGISVCFNRHSSIYYIHDFTADTIVPNLITKGLYMAIGPNPSDDGERMLFVGKKDVFNTHITAMELYVVDTNNMSYNKIPIHGDDNWKGLYLHLHEESRSLIRWVPYSGNNEVILTTQSKGVYRTYTINVNNGNIINHIWPNNDDILPELPNGVSGSCTLLDVGYNNNIPYALVMTQSFINRPTISLVNITNPKSYSITVMTVSPPVVWNGGGSIPSISLIEGEHCTGWLVIPKGGWNQGLVSRLHGGPHSFSANAFIGEVAYLLQAGFAVVLPNYRGSTSFGLEFLEALPGHAGTMDVYDCNNIVTNAIQELENVTGKKVNGVSVFGGSHGGFLCGHLMGASDPSIRHRYECGILWNPAVDLLSQCLTTDIPEWCFVEAFPPKPSSPNFGYKSLNMNEIERMRDVSATKLTNNVDKPVLVLLGESDQRVPHMGGLRWAQAVSVNGKCPSVDVYMYPGQGHAIDKPECNTNTSVLVLSYIMTHHNNP